MIEQPVRYLYFKGQAIRLQRQRNDYWEDDLGGIYAFSEEDSSVDLIERCGVRVLSLPTSHPLNDACSIHDKKYSNKVYQLFHTRKQADRELLRDLQLVAGKSWHQILSYPFYWLSRIFGKKYWEVDKTR